MKTYNIFTKRVFVSLSLVFGLVALLLLHLKEGGGKLNSRFNVNGQSQTVQGPVEETNAPYNESRQLNSEPTQSAISEAQIQSFLDVNGRSSSNLYAAYALTLDSRYLEELKTLPLDGLATITLGLEPYGQQEERLKWAKKSIEADPSNMFGYLLASSLSGPDVPPQEIFDLLKAGTINGRGINLHGIDIALSAQSLLEQAGKSTAEAKQFLGSSNLHNRYVDLTANLLKPLLKNYRELTEDKRVEFATVLIKYSQALGRSSDFVTNAAEFVQIGFEQGILKNLPPDVDYGESGLTVGQRYEQLKIDMKEKAEEYKIISDLLAASPPQVNVEYQRRLEIQGRAAAKAWLLKNP